MGERLVSPGVFTQEKDLSYLPQAVSEIGAAIIGPTLKGPALIPTVVESFNEFITKFGDTTKDYYTPYCAQEYLGSAGKATIVRVLQNAGYTGSMLAIGGSGSISGTFGSPGARELFPIFLIPTNGNEDSVRMGSTNISILGGFPPVGNRSGSASGSFVLKVVTTTTTSSYSCSMDSAASDFIVDLFGTSPQGSKELYVYKYFPDLLTPGSIILNQRSFATQSKMTLDFSTAATKVYQNAYTTTVRSQKLGGVFYNLFKFHTLSHGEYENTNIKIGIFGVMHPDNLSGLNYGTFNVVVREVEDDSDIAPITLETWTNCNLDPDSTNYIARVIGDRYAEYDSDGKLVYHGDYSNKSEYIRVEVDSAVKNKRIPQQAIPFGFSPLICPLPINLIPTGSLKVDQLYNSETNTKVYHGFDYTINDNLVYLSSIPANASTGSNKAFTLHSASLDPILSGSADGVDKMKFMLPMQYGFDGSDPRTPKNIGSDISAANVMGFDCSSATANGTQAYRDAIDAVSNQDEIDINMLILPGITHILHSSVTNYAIMMVEDRSDTFYLMDSCQLNDNVTTAVSNISDLDTSYAATYYPWVKISDYNTGQYNWVPPSVVMAGAISYNDKVGYEWYAPAGLNRGALTSTIEAKTRLTRTERDKLYEGKVNPLASFPGQGVVAWGQKTLQSKASALDRINVRRLLIELKKFLASSARYLVFDQNTATTRNRFLAIANPYLDSVQQKSGLYAYKVIMDDSVNTAEIIDRNILVGKIYLQPSKTAEYIILDFNILPTGATFPE